MIQIISDFSKLVISRITSQIKCLCSYIDYRFWIFYIHKLFSELTVFLSVPWNFYSWQLPCPTVFWTSASVLAFCKRNFGLRIRPSTSDPAPFFCTWQSSRARCKCLRSLLPCGRFAGSSWLLRSWWHNTNHRGHLGSEPENGKSLFFSVSLC